MKQIRYLLVSFAIASCSAPNELTETEKNFIIQEVRQTLKQYYQDIKANGLKAEFKYLDHSPDFFWLPPGYSHALSYDSVASVLIQNAPNFTLIENSFDTLHIVPLSQTLASYTGRLHSFMTDTSGKLNSFSLVETGVLVKRRDGWKLLLGQTGVLNQ